MRPRGFIAEVAPGTHANLSSLAMPTGGGTRMIAGRERSEVIASVGIAARGIWRWVGPRRRNSRWADEGWSCEPAPPLAGLLPSFIRQSPPRPSMALQEVAVTVQPRLGHGLRFDAIVDSCLQGQLVTSGS